MDNAGDVRAERVAKFAQCQLDGSIGREVGLEDREVGAFRIEVKPDRAIIAVERLAERATQVAGRAGDQDDGPAIGRCGHERPAMQTYDPPTLADRKALRCAP